MCSHYEAPTPARLKSAFGAPVDEQYQGELWPLYIGPFVRLNSAEAQEDGAPEYDISVGQFGLLPGWAKDRKLGRSTYNCRSETAATKNSFRTAWKRAQHCIIPAAAIYEPDWRSGKAVPTRIERADGSLMAIAGLWEEWSDQDGKGRFSFTMLTVNADDHPFMKNYHWPEDEKRMLAILPNGSIKDWLMAPAEASTGFLRQYPPDRLRLERSQPLVSAGTANDAVPVGLRSGSIVPSGLLSQRDLIMSERENLELESRRLQVEMQRMIVQSMRDTAEINRKNLEMLSKPVWRSFEHFWVPIFIGCALVSTPAAIVFLLHKLS